jgi:hypothetical protein
MEEFYNQFMVDFNQAETEIEKEIEGISEDIASVRISPGTWSIADCVVHISMIEFSVLNITRKIPDQSSELNKELTIIGRTKLKEILLDRTNKVKLPDAFESKMEKLPLNIAYEKLLTTRKLLKGIINSRSIISPELIIPHPVLGKMTKIDWLYSAPFHSMRHTLQIREVKTKLVKNF